MARPARGTIVERQTNGGSRPYALRLGAYGRRRYVTLGTDAEGWSRQRAADELRHTLADVARGLWQEPQPVAEPSVSSSPSETFHSFSSEWFASRELEGLAAKTLADLRWSLSGHLLPFFATHRLEEITPQLIDRFKVAKLRERDEIEREREAALERGERPARRALSNGSINHCLRHLAQILETAVEYQLIPSNPATGRRRRLTAAAPARPWVEPEQLPALLDAATGGGRLLLSLLAGASLRIGEALALRWRHVELGTGSLHIVAAKTEKGAREVHLTPALREELVLWRNTSRFTRLDDYVITTGTGRKASPSNLRRDVLAKAVTKANERLALDGIAPIAGATFHGLRRTYASLRCACGDDLRYVSDQLGHVDVRFSLRVYAQATKRRDRLTGPHLGQYDRALECAQSRAAVVGVAGLLETAPEPRI